MMVNINGLVFQWFRLPKIVQPIGLIEDQDVMRLFPNKCDVKLADNVYRLYKTEDIITVLKLDRFKEMRFEKDFRDCDDYTWAVVALLKTLLPGFAGGMIWEEVYKDNVLQFKHSLVGFVTTDLQLMFIEPQTGSIYTPMKAINKPYLAVI